MSAAADSLISISAAHRTAATEQLRILRLPLYAHEGEGRALEGAGVELKRRFDAEATLRRGKQLQATLAAFEGPDWARTLLGQDKGAKPWGFAQYVDPLARNHFDLEHYFARTDALLMFARANAHYGDPLSSAVHMQTLDWPGSDCATLNRARNVAQRMQSHDEKEVEEKEAARVYMASRLPDDLPALRTKFQLLKEHSTSIRHRARLPQYGSGDQSRCDALVEGVLSNVFIVIDGAAISSLYTRPRSADNVWVWAVDPDYEDAGACSCCEVLEAHRAVN